MPEAMREVSLKPRALKICMATSRIQSIKRDGQCTVAAEWLQAIATMSNERVFSAAVSTKTSAVARGLSVLTKRLNSQLVETIGPCAIRGIC